MAPNSPCFNYHLDNHSTFLQHQNTCSQQIHNPYVSWSSFVYENHLKLVKEKFAAVNSYYFKENYVEPVDNFSSKLVSVGVETDGQFKWLKEIRSIACMQLETMRKTMVQQAIHEKVELWQKKRTEMMRNRKYNISLKPKFQRNEISIKKENYKFILEQIQKRTQIENAFTINPQERFKEICFNASFKRCVSLSDRITCELEDKQFDSQIDTYQLLQSRIKILKTINVIEESTLVESYSLLNDLTLLYNNVVKTNETKSEPCTTKIDNKRNPLRKFSVNIPDKSVIKNVKRQYVALVKNNDALIKNLVIIENLPYATDPATKSQRQNIAKVTNTIVNTISSTSVAHLTDKYNKLNALLGGRFVCVANTNVMIGQNKDALSFCMNILAKKFLNQAEEVVSVKTQAAFDMANIAVKLWVNYPDFGKILYSEIKRKCPILVPFCCRAVKNVSEQQDYQLLGYKIDSAGNIENQDKYLKRMIGVVRFYAALIITSFKSNQIVLGLAHAWTLVAGILNKNPLVDITATILVEFLQIAGFAMHKIYGIQFIKLLKYIKNEYKKKIQLITPKGCGGPITRLNNLVSKFMESGFISEPKGILSTDFH